MVYVLNCTYSVFDYCRRYCEFWDAGEFIAVSSKLEVPHPPGAPFYLLLGRFFSFFASGNPEKIALAINFLSVVSSALQFYSYSGQ